MNNGEQVAQYFKDLNFTVKKYNSKSVWLMVDDRISHIEKITNLLSEHGCKHDPNICGSSIGALVVNGIKIFLKELTTANVLGIEEMAIQKLSADIGTLENGASIVLDNGLVLKSPNAVSKTPGTPKSDFFISNEFGESIHISHKKGNKPSHFQQWAGITEQQIVQHEYVRNFQSEMQRRYTELKPTQTIAMKIPNDESGIMLKTMAVYGVDSYNKSLKNGENKVDCLLQGTPKLEKVEDKKYRLTTDCNHVYTFPKLPQGGYEPVLSLVYKGDRDQLGIKGARAGIYPIDGRNFKEVFNG